MDLPAGLGAPIGFRSLVGLAGLEIRTGVRSDRMALGRRFAEVRGQTQALIAALSEADCQVQSTPDASLTKWHLAHTTWFFETFVLEPGEAGFRPFHPAFRVLFNSYYNGVGEQHPRAQRGLVTRPSLVRLAARRSADKLVVVGVNYRESAATITRFLDPLMLKLPTLLDSDGDMASVYTPRIFPSTVIFGRRGRPLGTVVGEIDWGGEAANRILAPLLAPGRPG